jgi:hypothetical protein
MTSLSNAGVWKFIPYLLCADGVSFSIAVHTKAIIICIAIGRGCTDKKVL